MKVAVMRKWLRLIHRDVSYVFAGMLLIYAVSGIALNHKDTFNSQYRITRTELQMGLPLPHPETRSEVEALLATAGIQDAYIQHYYPDSTTMKVFLKGNGSLVLNTSTGEAVWEQVRKRPVLGSLSKLHYNPGKGWTVFADVFAGAMILLVITGLFMLKGKHGLWGIGGIEFAIGILIPLLFLLL